MTHEEMVREFMEKYGQDLRPDTPTAWISDRVKVLRMRLMSEELGELMIAMHENDIVKIADALADLEYVVVGTAVAYGVPHEEVFQEVHRSNMTKDGLDRHGKGGKEGYSAPHIDEILAKHA